MCVFSGKKEKHTGSLVGKDYKRLLAKLEQRDQKVAKVKEADPEAAVRLEEKHIWQVCMSMSDHSHAFYASLVRVFTVCGLVAQTRRTLLARRAYHQCWGMRVQFPSGTLDFLL